MKKIIIILTIAALSFSCTDLDVVPKNTLNPEVAFSSVQGYEQYLSKLYGSFILTGQDGPANEETRDLKIIPDEGFTSYMRVYWQAQQLPTDETVIGWIDSGIQDLHAHSWNSSNQFVKVMYYRIYYLIALTNDFFEQSSESELASRGISEEDRADIATFRAEARFLRALAYWHALDLFGNAPLITESSTELPRQQGRQAIYDFIESELNEIEDEMLDPGTNVLGRADKAALWMLQSKLYMNARTYTGTEAFDQALTAINKVIDAGNAGTYSLSPVYEHLFLADNHTSPEAIFLIRQDGVSSTNWGGTTFMVRAAILSSMNATDFGVGSGWAGTRTTSALVNKFDDPTGNTDARASFHVNGQSLEIDDLLDQTDGYGVIKFKNVTADGERGSSSDFPDTDFIMFRLADAYLTYAELAARGVPGANVGTAVDLINELRERAYGNTSGNITAADLDQDFVLDERSRELYWEAHRRTDLVRYGQLTDGTMVWPWKGGVKEGTATGAFRNFFPIPADDLSSNPNLNPTEGYE